MMNNGMMNDMNMMNNQMMMMNNGMMNDMNMMNNPMMMMNNGMMNDMNMMNNQMMMNNMAMMNNQMGGMPNTNTGMNNQSELIWNILFQKKEGGQKFNIQISPNKKVEEAIKLFLEKLPLNKRNVEMKFVFNNKEVSKTLTICESGLQNGSEILVISTGEVIGA